MKHRTPLMCAVACGDVELCEVLIEHGADVNFGTWTQGMISRIISNTNSGIFWLLHRNDFNFTQHDTGIFDAISSGDINRVKFFLDAGVDVNCKHADCYDTPLHYLLYISKPTDSYVAIESICELLIERGADLSAKDINEKTPLECVPACLSQLIPLLRPYVTTKSADKY